MILIKCAMDARRIMKAIREFNEAPEDILKEISEFAQENMDRGLYTSDSVQDVFEMSDFLKARGFKVQAVTHEKKKALMIYW